MMTLHIELSPENPGNDPSLGTSNRSTYVQPSDLVPCSMMGFHREFHTSATVHRSNFCGLRCADTDVIQCTEGSIACIDGNQARCYVNPFCLVAWNTMNQYIQKRRGDQWQGKYVKLVVRICQGIKDAAKDHWKTSYSAIHMISSPMRRA